MPNWCHNTLNITGPANDAAALRSLVITPRSKFDFEAVVPVPAFVDDWQSWSWLNWGTTKVAFDAGWMGPQRAAKRDAQQVAFFSTAWSPPIPVIARLSKRFAALILRIQYDEPMWGFHGFATLQNGETVAAKHEEYVLEEHSVRTSHGLQYLDDPESVYIGLGHDADADQLAGRFAKGFLKISPDVSLIVQPALELMGAGFDDDFLNSIGARIDNNRLDRAMIAPHIHQSGVRHFFMGQRANQFVEHGVTR